MCQVGLQTPRTFQNRQIGWSSGLPVGASTQFKIHNVFHVSLLEPYHENPIPERHRESLVPVEIKGQEEFEVQEVLDSKKIRGKLLYLVFWRGYPPSEATWEPAGNLVHAQDLVNRFHQRYPNKLAPSGRCRLRRG